MLPRKWLAPLLVLSVLVADQILKIWVKTSFTLGESRPLLGTILQLHFVENYGMAFGLEFGGVWGKLLLSLFRISLIVFLGFVLHRYYREGSHAMVIISLSLILAGAIGNMIDSLFYGVIFSASDFETVAQLFPKEGGYDGLLHGRVVDMIYVELINISQEQAPSWFPEVLFGEDGHFVFFRPVFNIADAAITCGVILGLLFRRHFQLMEQQNKAA